MNDYRSTDRGGWHYLRPGLTITAKLRSGGALALRLPWWLVCGLVFLAGVAVGEAMR